MTVRFELVALDDDLGCIMAAYDGESGELLATGADYRPEVSP